MKRPMRVGDIVADTPGLGSLVQRARQFKALETLIRSWLPPALAAQVNLANLRDGTLVLSVKAAAWATKLRYEVPNILSAARQHEATRDVRDVRIRVQVDGNGP